jgi:hypothetical protein
VEPGLACLGGNGHDSVEVFWEAVDKARQRRSRIVQRLNVPKCTPRLFTRCGLDWTAFLNSLPVIQLPSVVSG